MTLKQIDDDAERDNPHILKELFRNNVCILFSLFGRLPPQKKTSIDQKLDFLWVVRIADRGPSVDALGRLIDPS